jgi:hypothetical protein
MSELAPNLAKRVARGSQPDRAQIAGLRFEKGREKTGGRQKGTPNAMPRELKLAIIEAANRLGSDLNGKDGLLGYLMRVGKKDMKTFCMLLRAVVPFNIRTEAPQEERHMTFAEAREELKRCFLMGYPELEPVVTELDRRCIARGEDYMHDDPPEEPLVCELQPSYRFWLFHKLDDPPEALRNCDEMAKKATRPDYRMARRD